jgi:hypothetical protein
MAQDPRIAAARYRLEGAIGEQRGDPEEAAQPDARRREPTDLQRAAYVETAIQQAIRRGEFDDLPGAGKPLQGLGRPHDPDWWIRRKIETERLSGLGPPALTLRVENVELDDRLDGLGRESDVREALEDFNRRVIEARRQLLGGPPVVTPTRDIEAELAAWRERRAERRAAEQALRGAEAAERPRRRRRKRRG